MDGGTRHVPVAGIGAGVEAAFFAFVMSDSSVMSTLGYVVALAAPIGMVAAIVLVCRKWRRLRYVLALLVLLAGVGVATGALGQVRETLADYHAGGSEVVGLVVTVVAALGPVPYGLARLTWLTLWPLGGGGGIDGFVVSRSLTAAERLQGGLFALACAVGVILTLRLVSRWGEVFPRWLPVLSGRPVPVELAVVPGTIVAAVITISALALSTSNLTS